jgi:hypothetical protein
MVHKQLHAQDEPAVTTKERRLTPCQDPPVGSDLTMTIHPKE